MGAAAGASGTPALAGPWAAMAQLGGSVPLALAWALLSQPPVRAEGPAPCEQQLRQRQRALEPEQAWTSAAALLSSACAIWLFVFYALRCLCARSGRCSLAPGGESCEAPWEGGQGSCADAEDAGSPSCGSQALACAQPHCGPRRPAAGQPQAAYARRLADMEWELESFLHEVRQQRCVLGEAAAEGSGPHSPAWDPDKLRITIYEIADREAAAGGERAGPRRRLR